mgnify:CR=1 FL=1
MYLYGAANEFRSLKKCYFSVRVSCQYRHLLDIPCPTAPGIFRISNLHCRFTWPLKRRFLQQEMILIIKPNDWFVFLKRCPVSTKFKQKRFLNNSRKHFCVSSSLKFWIGCWGEFFLQRVYTSTSVEKVIWNSPLRYFTSPSHFLEIQF